MRHVVPLIWEAVRADVAVANPINVEDYCQRFSALRPEIDIRAIRHAVTEAIAACCGEGAGSVGGQK